MSKPDALKRCVSTGSVIKRSRSGDGSARDDELGVDEDTHHVASARSPREGALPYSPTLGPASSLYNPTPQELPPPSVAFAADKGDRLCLVMGAPNRVCVRRADVLNLASRPPGAGQDVYCTPAVLVSVVFSRSALSRVQRWFVPPLHGGRQDASHVFQLGQ